MSILGKLELAVVASAVFCSGAAGMSVWSLLHIADEDSFRFRLTVVLRVDGQQMTASAVHEITAETEIATVPGTGGGLWTKGKGEAIEVDLPGKPSLYFLVADRGGNTGWYGNLIQDCKLNDPNPDPVARLSKFRAFEGPCELTTVAIPMAVRMDHEGDPFDFSEIIFPETNGPDGDVNLVSASVQRVDEPISNVLETLSPWTSDDRLVTIKTNLGSLRTNSGVFIRR